MATTRHLLGNDLVREARRRVGLTQGELAARAGTTQSAIARLETGRTSPSFETVLALVRHCGLDLEVMLVERDESDMWQAAGVSAMSPDQRVERHRSVTHQMRELRRAGERSRRGGA